jgi:carbonic anhydrase/acetyltransferase-like protein (isoleucine patch superfamily)
MVQLHGCEIGDNSLIGIGSVVLNNTKIGKNCIIGANTLLPENKEIPDNSMVMGAPGKVVKQLSDEQVQLLRKSAEMYIANAKRFKSGLKEL